MNRNKFSVEAAILTILPICMIEFSMGLGCGWITPAIQKLLEDPSNPVRATAEECSWIASLYRVGNTLGSLLCIPVLDILGRSFLLRTGSIIMFLAWMIIVLTRSVQAIMLSRFSFGLAVGICEGITSIYIGENCTPKIRGNSSCIGIALFYGAVLLAYILATYLPYTPVVNISAGISFICILCSLLAIESPQFLTLRGKYKKAEKNLMRLRNTTIRENIAEEYESMKFNIELEKRKKSSIKELISNPANYKSIIIVFVISVAQPGSGELALFAYIAVMFSSTHILSSNGFTILYGIILLISSTLCSLFIEKFNRRTITLISYAIYIFTNGSLALLYYFECDNPWMIFILIGIYGCFSVVMDSIFYIVRGELFPQNIKPFGAGFCNLGQSAIGIVTIKVFLSIAAAYGMHLNFIIYTIVSFLAFVFCFYFLPETRGKTLVEIQEIIGAEKVLEGKIYHRTNLE